MCRVRAEWVNETTRKELERALELEEAGAEGLKATPEGVFENAIDKMIEDVSDRYKMVTKGDR